MENENLDPAGDSGGINKRIRGLYSHLVAGGCSLQEIAEINGVVATSARAALRKYGLLERHLELHPHKRKPRSKPAICALWAQKRQAKVELIKIRLREGYNVIKIAKEMRITKQGVYQIMKKGEICGPRKVENKIRADEKRRKQCIGNIFPSVLENIAQREDRAYCAENQLDEGCKPYENALRYCNAKRGQGSSSLNIPLEKVIRVFKGYYEMRREGEDNVSFTKIGKKCGLYAPSVFVILNFAGYFSPRRRKKAR